MIQNPTSAMTDAQRQQHVLKAAGETLGHEIGTLQQHGAARPFAPELPDLRGTAFEELAALFTLSPFEQQVLFLAAMMELQTALFLPLCAQELGLSNAMHGFLCPYVLQQWLPETETAAFLPSGRLRHFGLIHLRVSGFETGSDSLHAIRITPGALAYLSGSVTAAHEIDGLFQSLGEPTWLGQRQNEAAAEIVRVYALAAQQGHIPTVNLFGGDRETALDVCRTLAFESCAVLDLGHAVQRIAHSSYAPEEALAFLRRDALLHARVLVVDAFGTEGFSEPEAGPVGGWSAAQVVQELCVHVDYLLILSQEPVSVDTSTELYTVPVSRPTAEEQAGFWAQALELPALAPTPEQAAADLRQLTAQFSLSAGRIQQLAGEARRHAQQWLEGAGSPGAGGNEVYRLTLQEAWLACQRQARKLFVGLAERIESRAAWEDLVLPADDLLSLREIASQIQMRHTVYSDWGYAGNERGLGIAALFSGVSGGGKTFAAEVLANHLGLDLYRIDLSSMASKWIGETEKNLKKLFDAADGGGAILLFDEADSIFGKRGETQGANDKYANLTTNYLLQRMEAYNGLAILTTNYEGNIDSAFSRRIRFTIRFREPDEAARTLLWKSALSRYSHLEDIDYAAVARTRMTGANIKTVALNASFLAAASRSPITMTVLDEAVRRELKRHGRIQLGAGG